MALRRSAALSAAIAVFVPSVASAQTPAPPAPPQAASATLLNPASFARLVHERTVETPTPSPVPAPKASPPVRSDPLRLGSAATARQALAFSAQPPRRNGAGFVQKTLVVLGVIGVVVLVLAASYYTGADTADLLSGFVGSKR
jgi:hypothetical protein